MKFHFSIPLSVRVVAYLFALGGFFHIAGFVVAFFFGERAPTLLNEVLGIDQNSKVISNLLVGVFETSIAAGLIDFSRFWRFMALAFIAVKATAAITAGLLVAIVAPMSNGNFSQTLFGWNIFDITAPNIILMPILLAVMLVYYGLQWWVLDRPQTRVLFFKPKTNTEPQPLTV